MPKARSYRYTITWCFKNETHANRVIEDFWHGTATSVPRAISKMVREFNAEDGGVDPIRVADLWVLDVRSESFDEPLRRHDEQRGHHGQFR